MLAAMARLRESNAGNFTLAQFCISFMTVDCSYLRFAVSFQCVMDSSVATAVDITLTEDDIPGAKLDSKHLDKYTVQELQWWLLCRGITTPTSWSKAQIIAKYVH